MSYNIDMREVVTVLNLAANGPAVTSSLDMEEFYESVAQDISDIATPILGGKYDVFDDLEDTLFSYSGIQMIYTHTIILNKENKDLTEEWNPSNTEISIQTTYNTITKVLADWDFDESNKQMVLSIVEGLMTKAVGASDNKRYIVDSILVGLLQSVLRPLYTAKKLTITLNDDADDYIGAFVEGANTFFDEEGE